MDGVKTATDADAPPVDPIMQIHHSLAVPDSIEPSFYEFVRATSGGDAGPYFVYDPAASSS